MDLALRHYTRRCLLMIHNLVLLFVPNRLWRTTLRRACTLKRGVGTLVVFILCLVLFYELINYLLPPRSSRQPLLHNGLSLVDTKEHLGPISAELWPHLQLRQ
jgi:hypothetical protein